MLGKYRIVVVRRGGSKQLVQRLVWFSFKTPPPPMEPGHPYHDAIVTDPRFANGPSQEEFHYIRISRIGY
ncbi:unnamed protein product [Ceratitis capitata]|uniref:(Mediterranean fruit fly) hypothetical protein n=1 Tax=Ceratitis capitata TaxID=7213 RepID=A0A811UK71_CERCA|nr:unnamed protein product [Ceratitis capitata]